MRHTLTAMVFGLGLSLASSPSFANDKAKEIKISPDLLEHLYQTVIVRDSQAVMDNLASLQAQIKAEDANQVNWQQLQNTFVELALNWKAMEAMYVAGDLSDDYLDHPRYVDYYHQGNESIRDQVEKALASDMPLRKALFKHSNKGINALEVMLHPQTTLAAEQTQRRLQAATLALQTMTMWLGEVNDFYQTDSSFVKGGKASISLLVNRLIDSSLKLASWRVGEAAGLTPKTKGNLHPNSLEFNRAQLSKAAVQRILQTHQQVIDNDTDHDLFHVGKAIGVEQDLAFLQTRLDSTFTALDAVPAPFFEQLETDVYKALYNELAMLQNAYYFMLINSLNLEARILDADGD